MALNRGGLPSNVITFFSALSLSFAFLSQNSMVYSTHNQTPGFQLTDIHVPCGMGKCSAVWEHSGALSPAAQFSVLSSI